MDLLLGDQADLAIVNAAEQGLAKGGLQGMREEMLTAQEKLLSAQEKLCPKGTVSAFAVAKTCAFRQK